MKSLLIAVLALALNASAGVVTVERINETIQRESGGNPHAIGRNGVVTEEFLDWVAMVESRNNPKAIGKLDELGAYQLRAIAVREVNRLTGSKWKHRDAFDPKKARIIARDYLRICERRVAQKTRESVYRKYRGLK